MQRIMAATVCVLMLLGAAYAGTNPDDNTENPTKKYLVWGDYKIEINKHGGLGRDWPTPDLFWEQHAMLKKKAAANPERPNIMRTILLVIPKTEATAYKIEDGQKIELGKRTPVMTEDEIKWALKQWREFEEMVYIFSGGNLQLDTTIKIIDEPLKVETGPRYVFRVAPQREFIDKYLPFERGEYQSYNSLYNSAEAMNATPHGSTMGAVIGIKGCGTSDNAWYGRNKRIDERTGYIFLHEWLNQQCSATSNMMPYPDKEALWNNYVLHKIGYGGDPINAWPWITARRDVMRFIIRPGMWRRWTPIDPYVSRAIGRWVMFVPAGGDLAREVSVAPASEGKLLEMEMDKYTQFDVRKVPVEGPKFVTYSATYYFRTYVESATRQEVRLWAGADERFQLWLNGVMVRDGWGWNYSNDDGKLFEKVTYTTLEKGINTLVLVLPNRGDRIEFRVRFCKTDGSGEQPEGVRAFPTLDQRQPLPLKDPVVYDFTQPKLYTWAEVGDNPWLSMPRLDEEALRQLTGIDTLEIRLNDKPYIDERGRQRIADQHLFFSVPKEAVTSPWIAEPVENSGALNNDFDFRWKSLACLRVPNRPGPEKDVLFLRFDVAEPLMHLLKTKGRPANESIVGWVLVDWKLAYVVLVNLDLDRPVKTELDLLSKQPE